MKGQAHGWYKSTILHISLIMKISTFGPVIFRWDNTALVLYILSALKLHQTNKSKQGIDFIHDLRMIKIPAAFSAIYNLTLFVNNKS